MGYEHFFTAPDGTELAVITRSELDQLRGLAVDVTDEDAADIAAADRAVAESDVRYPREVMDRLVAGDTPIAAWRKYRGLSQAGLATKSGITQAAISRLEKSGAEHPQPLGRRITRQAIARALDVTLAALEPLDD
ncbi:helix-turn-helix domain-containing protein [Sphingomonas adhaesiva]|uniref:helix-turn-helix domain-containing protein n=1 Tax=Sphingomonas adhaesiva TaxID=28212 RepID=UPI002FFBF15B